MIKPVFHKGTMMSTMHKSPMWHAIWSSAQKVASALGTKTAWWLGQPSEKKAVGMILSESFQYLRRNEP